jgi:hypothetical protein
VGGFAGPDEESSSSSRPNTSSHTVISADTDRRPKLNTRVLSKAGSAQPKPAYKGGRGGAGNYIVSERERAREEEERERKEAERVRLMEEKIRRDVERGLARPPRTYGGAGGAWEMVAVRSRGEVGGGDGYGYGEDEDYAQI